MNIHLDQKEFVFQLESHPEYPSLLAVSDTLYLFQIENAALHIHSDEIDALPNNFITKLKDTKEDTLAYVETHGTHERYVVYQNTNKSTFSKATFVEKWKGIAFLVEEHTQLQKKTNYFNFSHAIAFACFLSFVILVQHYFSISTQLLFLVFPLAGFFLSVIALQQLLNINNAVFDSFCRGASTQQCSSVVNSTQWKFLEKINFSDLSIVFFSFQIILFVSLGFTNRLETFFELQRIILFASFPVVFLSAYYQKFIAKKWCSVCVSIAGIILGELICILVFYQNNNTEITFIDYNLVAFLFLSVALVWNFGKDKLTKIQHLQAAELKASRFKKNYTLFRNTLIFNPSIVLPQTALIFGNKNAEFTLDFITNPFCGFCKEPYFMLKDILKRHEKDICIRLFFNHDLDKYSKESSQLVQHLLHVYEKFGTHAFFAALDDWYATKDLKSWLQKYLYLYDSSLMDATLRNHRAYFIQHKITFTPFLAINGYQFPKMYSITDLNYFIEELIPDNRIQLAERRKAINRVDTII